jgi:hypothetical protein
VVFREFGLEFLDIVVGLLAVPAISNGIQDKLFELGKNQIQIRDDEYEKARMLKNNEFSSQ